jgi:SAM-dependent methyltransferase
MEFYELHYQLGRKFWYFVYKTDLIKDFMEKIKLVKKYPLRILDVGCGTGSNLLMFNKFGNSFGLDNSLSALHFCEKMGLSRLVAADVTGSPFREESFDIVCALDLLEHLGLEGENNCLSDIYRILKKDSHLIITVPAFSWLWSDHDLAAGHKRRYTKKGLNRKLALFGFTVERSTYFNCFVCPFVFIFRKLLRNFLKSRKEEKDLYLDFDFHFHPFFTDILLPWISKLERKALRYLDLPFGVSLVCVCRK